MDRLKSILYWTAFGIAAVIVGGLTLLFFGGMFLTSFWSPPY